MSVLCMLSVKTVLGAMSVHVLLDILEMDLLVVSDLNHLCNFV